MSARDIHSLTEKLKASRRSARRRLRISWTSYVAVTRTDTSWTPRPELQNPRLPRFGTTMTMPSVTGYNFGEVVVQHWQAANLLKLSAIKPVLTTLDKHLVRKSLGRLEEADRAALKA